MAFIPKAQEIYRHFKGKLYQIITIAEHSETGEQLVIYQAMYGDFKIYARPLSMFVEKVDREKYPDVTQEYRFELQQAKEELSEEELQLDPLLLQFLDADTYEERLNILAALHHRITDDMLTTMAIVCDIEVKEGDIESRYTELRDCLLTREKYEINRVN